MGLDWDLIQSQHREVIVAWLSLWGCVGEIQSPFIVHPQAQPLMAEMCQLGLCEPVSTICGDGFRFSQEVVEWMSNRKFNQKGKL